MLTDSKKLVHFLLVEDDDDHAELVRMSLEHNNVSNTIDRVEDGASALDYLMNNGQYAESARPDVVILDLNLPKMNGHEVLQKIKQDEALRSIPVVVMTTSSSNNDRKQAYQEYANSYLTKPVNFAKFQKMVRDLNLYWSVWNQVP